MWKNLGAKKLGAKKLVGAILQDAEINFPQLTLQYFKFSFWTLFTLAVSWDFELSADFGELKPKFMAYNRSHR